MQELSEEDPLIGSLVADRYRVSKKLGEGGMGVVYLAVHEALRKPVALKLLATSGRIDREAVARFEREAIAAANLKHPNIAEATDFGRLSDGALYLVMEYVEGTTLRRLLREQGKLPPERALGILQQVASALATAHARDVVHRDLKPENVIVSSLPGAPSDHVKVIDFGIAKIRNATFGGGATGLTKAGTVFGTPEYMAPEQVMGQVVDAKADQYALGVLAFELLTGRAPFKADDVGQLMMMHVGAPVPSTRDRTPSIPPDADAVITRMLSKLPDERFASVGDAMQALAAAFAGGAASAGTPPPGATVKLGAGRAPDSLASLASLPDARLSAMRGTLPSAATVSLGPVAQASTPPISVRSSADLGPASFSGSRASAPIPGPPMGAGAYAPGSLPGATGPNATVSLPSLPATSATNPRATSTGAPAIPARSRSNGPPIIAIGIGVASLLAGVLLVVLLLKSCGGPPSLPSEVTAAIADWKAGKIEPAGTTIRSAIASDPRLADDETLAQALASQVGNEAARRALAGMMEASPLGRSKAMATALVAMAVKDDPPPRDGALELLRDRQDLLDAEQGARVRLRDAEECEELEAAKTEETNVASTSTKRDLERLSLGDCKRMVRVKEVCECKGGKGPATLGSGGPAGPGKSKGKGKKDKGRPRDD